MILTLILMVNCISRYHLLYIFRKRKDQVSKKNKMDVIRYLSLGIAPLMGHMSSITHLI